MIHASAYKNPHHVMLFFEGREGADTNECLAERFDYYETLRDNGKVVIRGDFWNQDKNFVIVYVSCDAELEQIIENDPAIKQNAVELVRAMPF